MKTLHTGADEAVWVALAVSASRLVLRLMLNRLMQPRLKRAHPGAACKQTTGNRDDAAKHVDSMPLDHGARQPDGRGVRKVGTVAPPNQSNFALMGGTRRWQTG